MTAAVAVLAACVALVVELLRAVAAGRDRRAELEARFAAGATPAEAFAGVLGRGRIGVAGAAVALVPPILDGLSGAALGPVVLLAPLGVFFAAALGRAAGIARSVDRGRLVEDPDAARAPTFRPADPVRTYDPSVRPRVADSRDDAP